MQAMDVRDREIELRLDAFARARLSPDTRSIARSRARIMREARLQFEAAQLRAQLAPPVVLVAHRSVVRRLAVPLLAASVWMVIAVGSIFAAQAGGPLYAARLWVEHGTLPSSAEARATTELARLTARLDEAQAGAARGDSGAVQAALDAYAQIADEAEADASGDATLEALVSAALDKHRAVLTDVAASLAAKGNDTAAAAVEAAIARTISHTQAVIARLQPHDAGGAGNGATGNGGGNSAPGTAGKPGSGAGGTGASTGSGSGPGTGFRSGTGAHSGAGAGAGTGASSGAGTGKPVKSPKPTPDPTPAPRPARTPATHSPHGQQK